MVVNAILLNDWTDTTSNLFIPGVQKTSSAYYYMFNATNEGFTVKGVLRIQADHYSGKNANYGKVSNWIIGNEIENQEWNYMGPMDLTNYVKTYEKAFRVGMAQQLRVPNAMMSISFL